MSTTTSTPDAAKPTPKAHLQYFVTSSPAQGFSGVWCAKRLWPQKGILISVDESWRDDVTVKPVDPPREGGAPLVVGANTWAMLKALPGRIFARPAGDVEEIAAGSIALVEARAKLEDLTSELKAASAEIARLQELAAERYTRITELEGILAHSLAVENHQTAAAAGAAPPAPSASPAPTEPAQASIPAEPAKKAAKK